MTIKVFGRLHKELSNLGLQFLTVYRVANGEKTCVYGEELDKSLVDTYALLKTCRCVGNQSGKGLIEDRRYNRRFVSLLKSNMSQSYYIVVASAIDYATLLLPDDVKKTIAVLIDFKDNNANKLWGGETA